MITRAESKEKGWDEPHVAILPDGHLADIKGKEKALKEQDHIQVVSPDSRLIKNLKSPSVQEALINARHDLARPYDSYTVPVPGVIQGTIMAGFARSRAAWLLGEAGARDAIPLIETNLARETSPLAIQLSTVALARLDPKNEARARTLIEAAKHGSEESVYSSESFGYWLEGGADNMFLRLRNHSDRTSAILALGYMKTKNAALEKKIDATLVEEFSQLVEKNGKFKTSALKDWQANARAEQRMQVLLMAMHNRKITPAFSSLEKYFQSSGYYVDVEQGMGGRSAHHRDDRLVIAALYRTAPSEEAAYQAVKKKLAEMNGVYRGWMDMQGMQMVFDAELGREVLLLDPAKRTGRPSIEQNLRYWEFVRGDTNLLSTMEAIHPEHAERLVRELGTVSYPKQMDFQNSVPKSR